MISSIQWPGAKNCAGGRRLGAWILGLLPQPAAPKYAEIYGGSAAVLLNKQRVKTEIYNDMDGKLVNFFEQLRDTDLHRLLDETLHSEEIYNRALTKQDSEDKFEAAWAFAVVAQQSFPVPREKQWWRYDYPTAPMRRPDWEEIKDRLLHVQISQRPAANLLRSLSSLTDIDIYCDPPYYSSKGTELGAYAATEDKDELEAALLSARGRVAVSGQNDEWDCLGWRKIVKSTQKGIQSMTKGCSDKSPRLEAVWCNYPPAIEGAML